VRQKASIGDSPLSGYLLSTLLASGMPVYLPGVYLINELLSVALYGLFMFYGLTAEELKDRRPLAKFLSIKLIVMFTFYQSFVVSMIRLNPRWLCDIDPSKSSVQWKEGSSRVIKNSDLTCYFTDY
jgi:hypothetical protein